MDSARLGTGGSHFSLLVYRKMKNTFFDLDPLCFLNTPRGKKLYENIKGFIADNSVLKETTCPQQGNSFDCGPYTLLFMERVIEKINTKGDFTPIHVKTEDVRRYRSNLQKLIKEIKSKKDGSDGRGNDN